MKPIDFQALESEAVLGRFRAVYEKMNSALDGMPYAELDISDEVTEQVSASSIMLLESYLRTDHTITHMILLIRWS